MSEETTSTKSPFSFDEFLRSGMERICESSQKMNECSKGQSEFKDTIFFNPLFGFNPSQNNGSFLNELFQEINKLHLEKFKSQFSEKELNTIITNIKRIHTVNESEENIDYFLSLLLNMPFEMFKIIYMRDENKPLSDEEYKELQTYLPPINLYCKPPNYYNLNQFSQHNPHPSPNQFTPLNPHLNPNQFPFTQPNPFSFNNGDQKRQW